MTHSSKAGCPTPTTALTYFEALGRVLGRLPAMSNAADYECLAWLDARAPGMHRDEMSGLRMPERN
eukprot:10026146-Alexandrium_andersonii.AAC.1